MTFVSAVTACEGRSPFPALLGELDAELRLVLRPNVQRSEQDKARAGGSTWLYGSNAWEYHMNYL